MRFSTIFRRIADVCISCSKIHTYNYFTTTIRSNLFEVWQQKSLCIVHFYLTNIKSLSYFLITTSILHSFFT